MNQLHSLSILILIALLSAMSQAPIGADSTKHFEKDGLAFDYPSNFSLIESDSPGVLTATITSKGSAGQIVVSLQEGQLTACDFDAENKKIADALIKSLANQIHAGDTPNTSPLKTQIGMTDVRGTQLHGVIKGKPATGDVYSFRLSRRFVNLTYVRLDNDDRAGKAWKTIRTTLKVEPSVIGVMTAAQGNRDIPITTDVINGKALHLPAPAYPAIARHAHASGTVSVQITIDESGDVISARAVEGHPLLQAASVEAARQAKFSVTRLCGELVRVTGIITYNFVAR